MLCSKGWHSEHAEAFELLFPLRSELSADLERDGTHGVRFPACNYAVAEALFAAASSATQEAPRRLFKHLTGPNSLCDADRAWANHEVTRQWWDTAVAALQFAYCPMEHEFTQVYVEAEW